MANTGFASFPNIYEQQRRNKFRTAMVIALFMLFLGFLGVGFDLFFLGNDPFGFTGAPSGYPLATLVAIGVGGASAAWGLGSGAKAVLASAHAYPVPQNDPRFRVLNNVVDEMVIAAGIPRPAVYIVPDSDPNAFAAGRDPSHSAIAVTEGLLESLSRDELQGVIAHELSHVKNYDIRLSTIVAALVGAAFWSFVRAGAPTVSIKKGSAHLCIVDPLGKKMNFREGAVAELFGTHPPLEKRITVLKAMAYSRDSAGATA